MQTQTNHTKHTILNELYAYKLEWVDITGCKDALNPYEINDIIQIKFPPECRAFTIDDVYIYARLHPTYVLKDVIHGFLDVSVSCDVFTHASRRYSTNRCDVVLKKSILPSIDNTSLLNFYSEEIQP